MSNREILFRVWDGEKMWFPCDENDLLLLMGDSGYFEVQDHGKGLMPVNLFNSADNNKAVMMQFTGLRDKWEKKIYEGDVVSYDNRLYEVAVSFNGYYLQRYKLWRGKFKPAFQYAMSLITLPFKKGERGENGGIVDSAEVVGNIYESPTLLESK